MEKIEGLFTAITAIVKEKEAESRLAISTEYIIERLKDEIDIYSVPVEVLADYALRAAVATGLNDNGYRSVVKGEGLYVNLENCKNPNYLARLFNNALIEEKYKAQVVSIIKKQVELNSIPGQQVIDLNTGEIIEEITQEQLIEFLRADAGEPTIIEKVTEEEKEEATQKQSESEETKHG